MSVDQIILLIAILASASVVIPLVFEVDHQVKDWPHRQRAMVQWGKLTVIPFCFGWMASCV